MSQPIHWQSAFWALATLALNTAVQDGGRILGFPAKYRLALRCSPFVCLFDTLGIICSIIWYLEYESFRRSVQLVAAARSDQLARSRKKSGTERILSAVVFIAAVLQLVKLCALKGIPWTQACGVFYFTSYLVQEALAYFEAPVRSDSPFREEAMGGRDESELLKALFWLGVAAVVLQSFASLYTTGLWFGVSKWSDVSGSKVGFILTLSLCGYSTLPIIPAALMLVFCIWIATLGIDFFIDTTPSLLVTVILTTVLRKLDSRLAFYITDCRVMYKWVFSLEDTWSPRSARDERITTVLAFLILASTGLLTSMQVYFLGWAWASSPALRLLRAAPLLMVSLWVLQADSFYYAVKGFGLVLAANLASLMVGLGTWSFKRVLKMRIHSSPAERQDTSFYYEMKAQIRAVWTTWAICSFGAMVIGCAIFYYSCVYDENGTFKPNWTENLG